MSIDVAAEKRAYKKFIAAGMTPQGACGLIDNLEAESDGFIPSKVEYLCIQRLREAGKYYCTQESYNKALDEGRISCEEFLHPLPGKQYGYGLAQWTTPARKSGLWTLAHQKGVSLSDEDMQLEYLLQELRTSYPSVMQTLTTATSIRAASDIVLKKFEAPANTGEAVCQSRAARGQTFYDENVKEDKPMGVTANDIIKIMQGWVGLSRSAGTHKPIIDLYNSYKPLARGYKVSYTDSYCDTTVSAAFIKAGAVSLIGGTECGVEEHVKIFQRVGIWKEDGTLMPEAGWIVCYNWDDGTQPNDGYSDHIGIVESVNKANRTFVVIEGNMNGGVVGRRTVNVGWGYIRGFAAPKYAKASATTDNKVPTTDAITVSFPKLSKGCTGVAVKMLQQMLGVAVDGDFGAETEASLKAFQGNVKLSQTGRCTKSVWKAILNHMIANTYK